MADKKVVFVAFAIEDVRIRDLIKGQSLHTDSPFEYIDMSVKEAYDEEWKKRVRSRILRSDGVIAVCCCTISRRSKREKQLMQNEALLSDNAAVMMSPTEGKSPISASSHALSAGRDRQNGTGRGGSNEKPRSGGSRASWT